MNKVNSALIFLFLLTALLFPSDSVNKSKIKILHITSYHTGWEWSDEQFRGFKDTLKDLNIEYKTFEMNTKLKSSIEWKEEIGKKGINLIESWKPDLVYLTDDNAQEYIGKYYVNKKVNLVFSGVNQDPNVYNYVGSKNVTGVIEREHITESVKLLKELAPDIKRIIVIVDVDITWTDIAKRIKFMVPQYYPEIEVVILPPILTFEEYKKNLKKYEDPSTAVASLGIYALKDAEGKETPFEKVLQWTVENSKLPDFTLWNDRVYFGTLCGVYLSAYYQGYSAGENAKKILIDKVNPSAIAITPSRKGTAIVNLARANKLGIKINSSLLLSVEVAKNFKWQK